MREHSAGCTTKTPWRLKSWLRASATLTATPGASKSTPCPRLRRRSVRHLKPKVVIALSHKTRSCDRGFILVNQRGACPCPGPDTSVCDFATSTPESGSTLRRTEELHRITPTKAASDALRARTVLPGGHGAEPETAGAIPRG